jgi:hypothetical protein
MWRMDQEMKLRLATRGIGLSADLHDYVSRRAHFSLGRFAGRIRSLSVHLTDVNGPRGGVDKLCDIRVALGLRQEVFVRERRANIHAAVAFAMDRAERAVQRQLKLTSMGPRTDTTPMAGFW